MYVCLVEFREVKGKLWILVSSDSGVGHRDENRHHFSSSTGNRGCSIHEEIEVVHQQTTTIDNHLELKQFQKILGTYGRIVFLAPWKTRHDTLWTKLAKQMSRFNFCDQSCHFTECQDENSNIYPAVYRIFKVIYCSNFFDTAVKTPF